MPNTRQVVKTFLHEKKFCTNDGSVMVGVVVLVAVMSIAAAGLMGTVRNTVSQETDSLNETKTYLAAEAGLLAGTNYFYNNNVTANHEFEFEHEGINVTVTIIPFTSEHDRARILSRAQHPDLPYVKALEFDATEHTVTSGDKPYMVGVSGKMPNGQESPGMRRTTVFDGPVHFNNTLWINGNDVPHFSGKVTVFNSENYRGNWGLGAQRQGYVNDYNYGVGAKRGSVNLQTLDNITFLDRYEIVDFQIGMKFHDTPPLSLFASINSAMPSGIKAARGRDNILWHNLPMPNANNDGSYLRLGVNASGNVCNDCYTFYRKNPTGNNFTSQTGTIPQEGLIIWADFNLKVVGGTVNNSVTVLTTGTHDITLDFEATTTPANTDSILYRRNNTSYSPPQGSPNRKTDGVAYATSHGESNYNLDQYGELVLAFYSNGNININSRNNSVGTITAQLLAPKGQVIVNNRSGQTVTNIFGAMSSEFWWTYEGGALDEDRIRVFHDRRRPNALGVIVGKINPLTGELYELEDGDDNDSFGSLGGVTINRWTERNCRRGDDCIN